MSAADPLDGRILKMEIDLIVYPDKDATVGHTDAAMLIGERIALELGLVSKRLGGEGCRVIVERGITVI